MPVAGRVPRQLDENVNLILADQRRRLFGIEAVHFAPLIRERLRKIACAVLDQERTPSRYTPSGLPLPYPGTPLRHSCRTRPMRMHPPPSRSARCRCGRLHTADAFERVRPAGALKAPKGAARLASRQQGRPQHSTGVLPHGRAVGPSMGTRRPRVRCVVDTYWQSHGQPEAEGSEDAPAASKAGQTAGALDRLQSHGLLIDSDGVLVAVHAHTILRSDPGTPT